MARLVLTLTLALALGAASAAQATQRTFTFTAYVDSINDPAEIWDTEVPLYVVVSYDDTATDNNADPRWGRYAFEPAIEPTGLWLYSGGSMVGTRPTVPMLSIGVDNEATYDSLTIGGTLQVALPLDYSSPAAQVACTGDNTPWSSDALPADLDLSQFTGGCTAVVSYRDETLQLWQTHYSVSSIALGDEVPAACYLQQSDATSHTFVCGTTTITVASGASALVRASAEAAGANCQEGGQRIDVGQDNGDGGGVAGDGVLQAGEVDESVYVCEGADGAAGAAGAAGADSLIEQETIEPGAVCAAGGQRLFVGTDDDGDGALDVDERDHELSICNGVDGADGADGAAGPAGPSGCASLQPAAPTLLATLLLLLGARRARTGASRPVRSALPYRVP